MSKAAVVTKGTIRPPVNVLLSHQQSHHGSILPDEQEKKKPGTEEEQRQPQLLQLHTPPPPPTPTPVFKGLCVLSAWRQKRKTRQEGREGVWGWGGAVGGGCLDICQRCTSARQLEAADTQDPAGWTATAFPEPPPTPVEAQKPESAADPEPAVSKVKVQVSLYKSLRQFQQ